MAAQIQVFRSCNIYFIFLSNLFAEHLEMLCGALGAPQSTVWEYLIQNMSHCLPLSTDIMYLCLLDPMEHSLNSTVSYPRKIYIPCIIVQHFYYTYRCVVWPIRHFQFDMFNTPSHSGSHLLLEKVFEQWEPPLIFPKQLQTIFSCDIPVVLDIIRWCG